MCSNQHTGLYGESLACKYLTERGFTVVARNVRTKGGEIDIVAEKDNTLHFVEVKTRTGGRHGKPYEAINYYKLTHMVRAARLYILQNQLVRHKLSLDVMSIVINTDTSVQEIKFFENITL